jgi:hypothetical protein
MRRGSSVTPLPGACAACSVWPFALFRVIPQAQAGEITRVRHAAEAGAYRRCARAFSGACLRRDGLVSLQKGRLELLNRKGLEEMVGWTLRSPASGLALRTMII